MSTSVKIRWPMCREHKMKIEYYPGAEVGSNWKCPLCSGAENLEEEQP